MKSLAANFKPRENGGQLLIEAMVAISIIIIGLFGVLNLLATSLGLNRVIADQYKAAYLASEGIEVIRSIIDENIAEGDPWNNIVASTCDPSIGGCAVQYNSSRNSLFSIQSYKSSRLRFRNGIYDYSPGGETTSFTRTVTVDMPDDGTAPVGCQLRVASRVNWETRGGGLFNIQIEDRVYNWRGIGC